MIYSQGQEQTIIENYFNEKGIKNGYLISIGENDGKTFSNALNLLDNGWGGIVIEPNKNAFEQLQSLHFMNTNVICVNKAVCDYKGTMVLHVNEPHIVGDQGLLSTLKPSEMDRWKGLKFTEEIVETDTFEGILSTHKRTKFNFITIDAEGLDYSILSQIDLSKYDVDMVCIEWNSIESERVLMTDYVTQYGMKEIFRNAENLIFAK